MQAVDLEVRVRPLDQVLAAHLDAGHLGLEVRAGGAVEAPQDLEAHGDGQRADEDTGGDDDAGHPGPMMLARRQGAPVAVALAGPPHQDGHHDRGHRAGDEG